MPKMNMTPDDKLIKEQDKVLSTETNQEKTIAEDQLTTSGIEVSAGEITKSEFDDTDYAELMQDYTNMRNGDPIAKITAEALKLPIMSAGWTIEPGESDESKETAEFVEWTLNSLKGGFNSFLWHSMLALDYGHIMQEKVWAKGRDWRGKTVNILLRLAPIQYQTIENFLYNGTMDFIGITHRRTGLNNSEMNIDISADKLFTITWNEEFGDVRGTSIYRAIRRASVYKLRLIDAMVRATQRGAGIPVFKTYGKPDSALQAQINQAGRTVGNADSSYIQEMHEKVEFRLESLQSQENIIDKIRYLDDQIFFNASTEFKTTGIGANGSRAATSEHKSSYEMKAGQVLEFFEQHINELVLDIVRQGPQPNIALSEVPQFKFNAITQADLQKVAGNLKMLVDSGIMLGDQDWEYVREQFGLPEIKTLPILTPTLEHKHDVIELELTKDSILLDRERRQTELEIFSLDSAVENFVGDKVRVRATIEEVHNKLIRDMARQIKANPDIEDIQTRFMGEAESKMSSAYDKSFRRGKGDFNKELEKIGVATKLDAGQPRLKLTNKRLSRKLKSLWGFSKDIAQDFVEANNVQLLIDNGTFEDKFKTKLQKVTNGSLTGIAAVTQAGYQQGRMDAIKQTDKELILEYTAILDGNLCDECAPQDAVRLSVQEWEQAGINVTGGQVVNPNCLGNLPTDRDQCRCQLIPVEERV